MVLSPRRVPPAIRGRRHTTAADEIIPVSHLEEQPERRKTIGGDEDVDVALEIEDKGGAPFVSPRVTAQPVEVYHWYRRACRKLADGVPVIKVTSNGNLVRRILLVGHRPEYIELKGAKLFDCLFHLGDLESAVWGCHSPAFAQFRVNNPTKLPRKTKCIVIQVALATISLIFKSEADRRDAQFLLRCQRTAVLDRWAFFRDTFEKKQKEAGLSLGV